MTPRKSRGGRPNTTNHHHHHNNHNHNHNNQYLQQYPVGVSDYESDNLYSFPDAQHQQQQQQQSVLPSRTNEELNNAVLRRHNPEIASILSLAPYAVVYAFNPESQQWEKTGMEGSMFVCQLVPAPYGQERYSVFVLNRRGLNNFDLHLTDENNVEITDEFVILKSDAKKAGGIQEDNTGAEKIYGLWIYSEPPPNSTAETRKINAQVIKECAIHAGQSLLLAREKMAADQSNGYQQQQQQQQPTPNALKELFGQQTVPPPPEQTVWPQQAAPMQPQVQPPAGGGDVLGDLFRRAGLVQQNL
ncbi:hypothetical protein PISL3812_04217 [Talaromyces islandicus]|uniref:Decapping enzyme Dcp1 n=1 Tax=Talaromyces islandicus TaxID=28573 RepID=A0A0U1LX81_TALIS|nr:hypothetical protein PISL3812_04217 [Talaromyces islandicus]